jgi:putative transposase
MFSNIPDELVIHADRGPSMTSKTVAQLLVDLGVEQSHSRPHVSNDNPYSEAQFKTMKYRPDYPDRFGSIEDARAWARRFFTWYNEEHHHTGLALMPPSVVHYGQGESVRAARGVVLSQAYAEHPERFVRGVPTVPTLPEAVWINKPKQQESTTPDVMESVTEVTLSGSDGEDKSVRLDPILTKRVSQKQGQIEALDLVH